MDLADRKACFDPTMDVVLMMVGPAYASVKSKNASKWTFTIWQLQVCLNICFGRIFQPCEDEMNLKWRA